MRRSCASWALFFSGVALLGCSPDSRPSARAPLVGSLRLGGAPAALAVMLDSSGPVQYGRVAGDTTTRMVIRPLADAVADYRLCGVVAGAARIPPALLARWAVDTNAPVLAWRALTAPDVQGVRFLQPGRNAFYYFEGITRDGGRRVSVRWPVAADPSRPVPVGAPDSLIEALLRPSPRALDSLVGALTIGESAGVPLPDAVSDSSVRRERAVLLVRDLPIYEVTLSPACPRATVAVPVLARTDVLLRVPTSPGDLITAHADVTAGTVRIGFDEALPPEELRQRASVRSAVIEAGAAPRVTLRVRVQVVPRAQETQQMVYLTLHKTRPAR
ncbi:hypothetical protein [Gemmatimonas sp.]|uniref:hypothetical protein n=1 Tax=Gemmatimonas sp. TaxID=1962908 RepID=UPI003F719B6D